MTPRLRDLRAVYELANECRDLGDDTTVWRGHLFARLGGLIGAGVVMGGDLTGLRAGRPYSVGVTEWGFDGGFDKRGWDRATAEFARDPSLARTPALAEYVRRMRSADGVALARSDLLPDTEWHRAWDYENLHRAVGVDHTLWCFRARPGGNGEGSTGLLAARAGGERDFTPAEKCLVECAVAAIAPLVGGALAGFADPSPSELPPRTRQVLKCLLEGDGDKQVAARLGLSVLTVNQHTKRIYRHFGVQSRAELLARWVRRGWGAGAAWAD